MKPGKKKVILKIALIAIAVLLCGAVGAFMIWQYTRHPMPTPPPTTVQTTIAETTTLPADVTPPVITGAADLTVTLGETIAYRSGVTAVDPEEGSVALQIDASKVNAAQAGTYPIVYFAEDSAGNRTEVAVQVKFLPEETKAEVPQKDTENKDYTYYAKKVLNKILKSGMTDKEKIKAIWKWTRYEISYKDHGKKGDWKQAALTGFTKLRGDCYTFFATAKALLNQAGFSTKDVVKIKKEGRSDHYWLLVRYKGNWYHFDACPRRTANGKTFCLYTDQQMLEFSETHDDCFDFDLRKYPRTPGKIADKYLMKFYPELFEETPTAPQPEPTEPEATEATTAPTVPEIT